MFFWVQNLQGGERKGEREVCTLDGTVDWHGHPAIRSKSGGWFAGTIILCKPPKISLSLFHNFKFNFFHLSTDLICHFFSKWKPLLVKSSTLNTFYLDFLSTCFLNNLVCERERERKKEVMGGMVSE